MLNAPVDDALLTGPPFVNPLWRQLTDDRDPGSPESLPIYEDGRTVRFTAGKDALDVPTGNLVTMWQVLFDLPVAGDIPAGYGHLYTSGE